MRNGKEFLRQGVIPAWSSGSICNGPSEGSTEVLSRKGRKSRCGCSSDEELKRGQLQLSEKQSLVSEA